MAHVMTPARRAALRKAQLASAAKRRRYGVGSQVRRATRQRVQYAGASAQVARRHVGRKGFSATTKRRLKTAGHLAVAGAVASAPLLASVAYSEAAGNHARMRASTNMTAYGTTNRRAVRHLKKAGWTGRKVGVKPGGKVYIQPTHVKSRRGAGTRLHPPLGLMRAP